MNERGNYGVARLGASLRTAAASGPQEPSPKSDLKKDVATIAVLSTLATVAVLYVERRLEDEHFRGRRAGRAGHQQPGSRQSTR
jgi:hypothetical protein